MQTNLDRNVATLTEALKTILPEQSKAGFFGRGSLAWSLKDGVVQVEVDASTQPRLRLKKSDDEKV